MSGILGATYEYRSNKYYYDVNEDGDGPVQKIGKKYEIFSKNGHTKQKTKIRPNFAGKEKKHNFARKIEQLILNPVNKQLILNP